MLGLVVFKEAEIIGRGTDEDWHQVRVDSRANQDGTITTPSVPATLTHR